MMEESRRLHYLKVMGVESFVPRLTLPGAAVSPQLAWPTEAIADATLPEATTDTSARTKTIPVIRPLVDSASESDKLSAELQTFSADGLLSDSALDNALDSALNKTVVSQTDKDASEATVPTFQLSMTTFRSGILAIDSVDNIPVSYQPFCQRLLADIVFAFGASMASYQVAEAFNWPMVRNSQIDQSASVAVASVNAFIAAKAERYPLRAVLVFGETTCQYLFPHASYHELLGTSQRLDKLSLEVLVTHSLYELLTNPLLKRETWRHLQPLADLLIAE